MKRKIYDKVICRRAGFSLSEALLAVLLVSIMFVAATVGVNALYNAYQKITVQAEAQVLLSTAVSEITNDIHGVTQVKKNVSGSEPPYEYFTTSRNTFIAYGNGGPGTGITVISEPFTVSGKTISLLPDATHTQKLYTQIEDATFNEATGVFYCTVKVLRDGAGDKVYESTEIYIRPYSRNLIVS